MSIETYFPQGIASGQAFLGRKDDANYLRQNIESGHHTLILATRRYGKTSLVLHTLNQLKIPYVNIDLHLAISDKAVERKIIKAVQQIISQSGEPTNSMISHIQKFFSKSQKKWTLGLQGVFGLELTPDQKNDVTDNILTALELCDSILHKQNKRAVMFIDEIQEIQDLDNASQIAGSIRHFAQTANRKLTFIFSGSNRRMLAQMFDEQKAPLYELCDRLIVERIPKETYRPYLNRVAKKTFGTPLDDKTANLIFKLSECHPRRIYNLCYYLFQDCINSHKVPDENAVQTAWKRLLNTLLRSTRSALSHLSSGQIKVLSLIALDYAEPLTGRLATQRLSLSSAAISKATSVLEEKDFIESHGSRYRIIDPIIRDVLVQHEQEAIEAI